jgi:hypothetical protein
MRSRVLAGVLLGAACIVGCTTLLGTFEVGGGGDAGISITDAGVADVLEAAVIPDAPVDSPVGDTGVEAGNPQQPCALPGLDGGPGMLVYPGDPCSFDSQLKPVPSVGACKPGKWACIDFGTGSPTASCFGATAPAPELCTLPTADEDCDGTIDNGCTCSGDVACGVGACSGGVQRCINNKLGACSKLAGQPKCDSADADGNCNGMPDKDEAVCKCQGQDVGSTRICPNNSKNAQCNNIKQTCVVSKDGSQAQWDIPCPSGFIDCRAGRDSNCNGQPDVEEEECHPCLSLSGTTDKPSPATEVFPTSSAKGAPVRVLGCGHDEVTSVAAGSRCRSVSTLGLLCTLCPMEAWLNLDPGTVPQKDYWTRETPVSPTVADCSFDLNPDAGGACRNGRVCASNQGCVGHDCRVPNYPKSYPGLGCGFNQTGPVKAGALCCCQ